MKRRDFFKSLSGAAAALSLVKAAPGNAVIRDGGVVSKTDTMPATLAADKPMVQAATGIQLVTANHRMDMVSVDRSGIPASWRREPVTVMVLSTDKQIHYRLIRRLRANTPSLYAVVFPDGESIHFKAQLLTVARPGREQLLLRLQPTGPVEYRRP